MPPPTVGDSWLTGRHFGIVIDAGSSGSRLQIYSWRDPRTIIVDKESPLAYTLPKVEKGTQDSELWVTKVEPGLSSKADDPESVGAYLRPLLNHAYDHIPPSLHHDTPLFLLATAGMRLLAPTKQAEILEETCRFLVNHSNFKIDSPSEVGPCGSSVRIITGEEEGLFGWIAVNYLMDGFTGSSENRTTYGFLDMGGASTQIAFEPSPAHQGDGKNLIDVRLRLLGGKEIHHKVFVTTWLGYGTNQARERYVGKAITEFEKTRIEGDNDVIPDPCLPKNLKLTEVPMHSSHPSSEHLSKSHVMLGTGSFEQCIKQTSSLLNKNTPCPDTPCLMNGVHVPPIDFSVSHFIGVSEYWYSSEHIFGLGGAYDYVQYERAAAEFCSRNWEGILEQHENSRAKHRLGGDGEVEKDGKIVEAGIWGPKVELPRLQMQCFKAAWISNVLHEGIGMPRIVDFDNNVHESADKVVDEATKKGLGRPIFQSVDSVGEIAISWTLGKMVLEASKEVQPLLKSTKPLMDPIDDMDDIEDSPIHPIRPPFLSLGHIEDRLTPHLPASLTRSSLGFSPVLFLLYVLIFFVILLVTIPMRRRLRSSLLRVLSRKRDTYGLLMEEGKIGGGSRPPSPGPARKRFFYRIRRLLPFSRPNSPKLSMAALNGNLRHPSPHLGRNSPTSPFFASNGVGLSSQYKNNPSPRSMSPAFGYGDDNESLNGIASNISSRSHNGSQMNLSTMVPRSGAISRVNSINIAGNGLHHDE